MAMSLAFGGRSVTSRSPMNSWPALMVSSPAIMLSVVVLPQPDGPTSTTNEPSAISRLRRGITTCEPKRFSTSTRETLAIVAFSPASLALDRADEIAAGDPAIGKDEENGDRNLRDDETRRGQIEGRDIAVAVQLQHANGDGKDRLVVEEHEGEDELLPDRDEVQRVADHDAGHRKWQDHLGEDLKVGRPLDLRRLFDIARNRGHEAAQDEDLRRHAVDAVNENEADAGVEEMQPAQDVVKGDQNRLLRQHEPGEQEGEDVAFAGRVEAAQRKGRHDCKPDSQRRSDGGVDEAVLEQDAEIKPLPNLPVGVEIWRYRERERPIEELRVGLDGRHHHERERPDPHGREK